MSIRLAQVSFFLGSGGGVGDLWEITVIDDISDTVSLACKSVVQQWSGCFAPLANLLDVA